VKFTFSTGYFSVPSELIAKWAWTGLLPVDLLILCAMLKHAHGDSSTAHPSFTTLADETGISRPTFNRRIAVMKQLGIIEVMQRPGTTSIVDLDGLKTFIKRLKRPVDGVGNTLADPSHRRHTPLLTGDKGQTDENVTIDEENQGVAAAAARPNKVSEQERPVETKGAAVEIQPLLEGQGQLERPPFGGGLSAMSDTSQGSRQGQSSTPDGRDRPPQWRDCLEAAGKVGNPEGSGRVGAAPKPKLLFTDSELLFLAKQTNGFKGEVDGYDMAEYRQLSISTAVKHAGTVRQGIEEAIRLELRHSRIFGIKARILHHVFTDYPIDGIIHWANQAHRHARHKSSYFLAMLKKTRGDYPRRKQEVG
jgi:hypothetical protein